MGLVCADPDAEAAMLFREAAHGLGAQVTVLDPAKVADDAASLQDVARLLGRLYGAIECQGLPACWVRRLAQATAVPVFDGLAEASPAPGPRADAAGGTEHDRRVRAVQAALLAALR
ncbi:hypothetical protein [Roseateles aquatilis]|nr:hypothetical protein [Roseateles aquatilis]